MLWRQLVALSVLFAYLFLVAQYSSWSVPLAVMLSTVVSIVGAVFGLWLTGTPLSIYAQLVFAKGAGSGSLRAIGICTCAGMLASTFVGILFVPALYSIVERIREAVTGKRGPHTR